MAALRLWAEGGKSGLHGGTVPGNARRGRPQGKCHRKYTAGPSRNTGRAARVKRCGKSAPRRRQRRRQGKPHREQDQVGAAGIAERSDGAGRTFAPPLGSVAGGVRRRAPQRNGHHRLGRLRQGQDRTRLTRRLAPPRPGDVSARGRFGGSSRDKCGFQGTSLWIANFVVAGRNQSASVADCVVETQGFAALAR